MADQNGLDYLACEPTLFEIDKDIILEMINDNNGVYISIYNDRNDKSVSFQVTKDKVKGLADFLTKHLENN